MVAPYFVESESRQGRGTLAFKGGNREKPMGTDVSSVYLHVVEDVINNLRAEFQGEGVDDAVLSELQQVSVVVDHGSQGLYSLLAVGRCLPGLPPCHLKRHLSGTALGAEINARRGN